MKHEYKKPTVKYIDYAYDEQVVATSAGGNKIDGLGDGYQIYYCTYVSDVIGEGCSWIHNSEQNVFVCDKNTWSLRSL